MAGSIEQRGPNRWRLVVSAGRDQNGKRVKITRTVNGKKREAERELSLLTMEVETGRIGASAKMTLGEWVDKWLTLVEKTLAPSTLVGYRHMLNNRIRPALSHIALDRIQPKHIAAFYDDLAHSTRLDVQLTDKELANGRAIPLLSANSQLKYHRLLSLILQEAVYRGLIPQNPTKAVRPPRATRTEAQHYDEADVTKLLAALATEPLRFRVLVAVALTTGARRGEIVALRWEDVDWERGQIRICHSAYLVGGEKQGTKGTKTGQVRVVPLVEPAKSLLAEWQTAQTNEREALPVWCGDDFIFTEETGNWTRVDNVTKRWKVFLGKHKLPALPFHGLRHTAASVLLGNGLPVRTVAGLLGHAQASTTLNIYGHVLESSAKQATEILERVTGAMSPVVSPNGDTTAENEA